MIKVRTKEGKTVLHTKGSVVEIAADVVIIMRTIRDSLAVKDAQAAADFVRIIENQAADGIMFADMDVVRENAAKKMLENLKDILDKHFANESDVVPDEAPAGGQDQEAEKEEELDI